MMVKRLAFALVLLALGASLALAAPMSGKVISINKPEVRVVVKGKLADWVKKGAPVRFLSMRGTITGVSADTVSISSPKAEKTKVGAIVTLEKPRSPSAAGC
jgi:hypothetical protein